MPECRKSWKVIRCVSLRSSPWNVISFATKPHASHSCVCTLSQRNTRCLVLYVSNLFDLFYRMTMVTDLHCLMHAARRPFLPCRPWSLLLRVMVLLLHLHAHFHWRIRVSLYFAFVIFEVYVVNVLLPMNRTRIPHFFHCGLSSLLRQMTTLLIHLHTHFHGEICIAL